MGEFSLQNATIRGEAVPARTASQGSAVSCEAPQATTERATRCVVNCVVIDSPGAREATGWWMCWAQADTPALVLPSPPTSPG
jgi:hypothetical protein